MGACGQKDKAVSAVKHAGLGTDAGTDTNHCETVHSQSEYLAAGSESPALPAEYLRECAATCLVPV